MIFLISFSKIPDVLPAFTCAIAIGNLGSICLGVIILSFFPCFALHLTSDTIEEQFFLKAKLKPRYTTYEINTISLFETIPPKNQTIKPKH